MKPVVFLMGPTAAGKTALALRLCEAYPFEIISVDSSLVYRHLNVGSAKPAKSTLRKFPHHLVDIREPHETYSAAEFRHDALQAIDAIHANAKIPLLVGGTGLYFRTLECGIAELPAVPNKIRAQLRDQHQRDGSQAMHTALLAVDPESAGRIHPNDPQRILRALEIYHASGRPMGDYFKAQTREDFPFKLLKLVLAPADKSALHEPIAARFEHMLASGFVNEVMKLRANPQLSLSTPALRAVGYRAVWQFLEGQKSRAEMVHDGVVATRRLAKRQYTWFRRENDAKWVDSYASGAFAKLTACINREVFSG